MFGSLTGSFADLTGLTEHRGCSVASWICCSFHRPVDGIRLKMLINCYPGAGSARLALTAAILGVRCARHASQDPSETGRRTAWTAFSIKCRSILQVVERTE